MPSFRAARNARYSGTRCEHPRTFEGAIAPARAGLLFVNSRLLTKDSGIGTETDGSVVVGFDAGKAYKWVYGSGLQELPPPANMTNARADATSADGSVVVGGAERNGDTYAIIWRGTTPESVGTLARGFHAVSADGTLAVSEHYANQPMVWEQSKGLRRLTDLLNERGAVLAEDAIYTIYGLSRNGRFIGGRLSNGNAFRARLRD